MSVSSFATRMPSEISRLGHEDLLCGISVMPPSSTNQWSREDTFFLPVRGGFFFVSGSAIGSPEAPTGHLGIKTTLRSLNTFPDVPGLWGGFDIGLRIFLTSQQMLTTSTDDDADEISYANMEAFNTELETREAASTLPRSIEVVYSEARIDDDSAEDAREAVREAVQFTQRRLPGRRPRVGISEDGVVTLQWQDGDEGVLLVFIGDETVSCSIKKPGGFYAMSDIPVGIGDELPCSVASAIDYIEAR